MDNGTRASCPAFTSLAFVLCVCVCLCHNLTFVFIPILNVQQKYGTDGKEDLEFRLLHVYYSAKRAVNKGAKNSPARKVRDHMFVSDTLLVL
jgi:hypothetical protein